MTASLRWSGRAFSDDPAEEAMAQAAQSLSLDRHVGFVRPWYAAGDEEREPWRETAFVRREVAAPDRRRARRAARRADKAIRRAPRLDAAVF